MSKNQQAKQGFIKYHLEKGFTEEQAEEKWNALKKYGVDYKLSNKLKYK